MIPTDGDPATSARYRIDSELGRGGMGRVYKAWDAVLERWVAMKVLDSGSAAPGADPPGGVAPPRAAAAAATGPGPGPDPATPSATTRAAVSPPTPSPLPGAAPAGGCTLDAALVARFRREARVLAALEHPNIVPTHDAFLVEPARLFFIMKLVEGETLADALRRARSSGPAHAEDFPLARRVHVVRQVAQGIAFAHSRGVIHRDLKPTNVMLGAHGQVLVMDWGLARLRGVAEEARVASAAAGPPACSPHATQPGQVLGTPAYMAPEQARGDSAAADERTDVYALGALLHECLSLRPPVSGAGLDEVIARVTRGEREPLPASLPRPLRAIAARAMEPDPARRYASAAEFADDLQAFVEGRSGRAWRPTAGERLARFVRGHRTVAAGAAGGALVVGLALWAAFARPQYARLGFEPAQAGLEVALRRDGRTVAEAALPAPPLVLPAGSYTMRCTAPNAVADERPLTLGAFERRTERVALRAMEVWRSALPRIGASLFNTNHLRLADLDGDGLCDIVAQVGDRLVAGISGFDGRLRWLRTDVTFDSDLVEAAGGIWGLRRGGTLVKLSCADGRDLASVPLAGRWGPGLVLLRARHDRILAWDAGHLALVDGPSGQLLWQKELADLGKDRYSDVTCAWVADDRALVHVPTQPLFLVDTVRGEVVDRLREYDVVAGGKDGVLLTDQVPDDRFKGPMMTVDPGDGGERRRWPMPEWIRGRIMHVIMLADEGAFAIVDQASGRVARYALGGGGAATETRLAHDIERIAPADFGSGPEWVTMDRQGRIAGFRRADGAPTWSFEAHVPAGELACADFTGSGRTEVLLLGQDGSLQLVAPGGQRALSSHAAPDLIEERVRSFLLRNARAGKGRAVESRCVGGARQQIEAIDPESGAEAWRFEAASLWDPVAVADQDGDGWEEVAVVDGARALVLSGATGAVLAAARAPSGWQWRGWIRAAAPAPAGPPRPVAVEGSRTPGFRGYALWAGNRLDLLWEEPGSAFELEQAWETEVDGSGRRAWCLLGRLAAPSSEVRRELVVTRQWRLRGAEAGASLVLADGLDDPCADFVPLRVPDRPGMLCVPVGRGKVGLYDLARQGVVAVEGGGDAWPTWAGVLDRTGALCIAFGGHMDPRGSGGGTMAPEIEVRRLAGGRLEPLWVNRRAGSSTVPQVGDLDGDGVPDLVVGSEDHWSLVAVSGADGRTLWVYSLGEELRQPPSVLPGNGPPRLYLRTATRRVVLDASSGRNAARWVAGFGGAGDGALR